jgi:hypothetical protein
MINISNNVNTQLLLVVWCTQNCPYTFYFMCLSEFGKELHMCALDFLRLHLWI